MITIIPPSFPAVGLTWAWCKRTRFRWVLVRVVPKASSSTNWDTLSAFITNKTDPTEKTTSPSSKKTSDKISTLTRSYSSQNTTVTKSTAKESRTTTTVSCITGRTPLVKIETIWLRSGRRTGACKIESDNGKGSDVRVFVVVVIVVVDVKLCCC